MTVPRQWKGAAQCGGATCLRYKLSLAWWYNYIADVELSRAATFIPMDWDGEGKYGDIEDVVATRPSGSYYMIYNEPDVLGQAEHAPIRAADNYFAKYRAIRAIDDTAKIGGINLSHMGANGHCDVGPVPPRPAGKDYLVEFLKQLEKNNDGAAGENAKFDFYAVHAYAGLDRMKAHLDWLHGDLHDAYSTEVPANVPVWITETSRADRDMAGNQAFMAELWSWLNTAGKGFAQNVVRVAWFSTYSTVGGWVNTNLFQADMSTLTDLGKDWLAKEDNFMAFTGDIKTLVVQVTGSGTRYKDYTWNHGMGSAPIAVVPSMGMTGVGEYWVVNTYNPSSSQIKFRISHVDGVNWANTLTLTAVGFWN